MGSARSRPTNQPIKQPSSTTKHSSTPPTLSEAHHLTKFAHVTGSTRPTLSDAHPVTKFAHVTPGFNHASQHSQHRRRHNHSKGHTRAYYKKRREHDLKILSDHHLSTPPSKVGSVVGAALVVVPSSKLLLDAVLHVSTLLQLRHVELLRLPLLSKEIHKILTLDDEMSNTFWQCLCASFASKMY